MKLSKICIERPVLSFVLNAIIVLCGLLSISYVKLQFEPTTFQPTLRIQTKYPGASAAVVQKDVTQPLVAAFSGTENLSFVEGESEQGESTIQLNFGNIDQNKFITAQSQVIRVLSSVNLPQNASTPQVRQRGSNSQIMFIGFQDSGRSTGSLTSYIQDSITKQLEQIPGVGDVQVYSVGKALRIELNPQAMARLKISATEIVKKLNQLNQSTSAGQIFTKGNSYTINVNASLDSIEAFQKLIIADHDGEFIHLNQIARVYLGSALLSNNFLSGMNGKPGVVVSVSQTSDANPIDVAKSIRKALNQIRPSLPPGMTAKPIFDISVSLKSSLYEVVKTIVEAILLVSLISLAFLGRFRAALIPIVTLPVCLIGVFIFIWPLGFSINMMTLLAIVLAVGLVVDDAIVVLENCYRYIEEGYSAYEAAILGIKQIGFAIIGMTVTLIAVYIPIAFLNDKTAVFFREFAFTLAASVLISGFVALTLSPTMCAHALGESKPGWYEIKMRKFFNYLERGYGKILAITLQLRFWVVAIFLILIVAGVGLFKSIPSTLQPKDTIGAIGISLSGTNGGSVDFIRKKLAEIHSALPGKKVFSNSFSFISGDGSNAKGFSFNVLKQDEVTNANKIAQNLNKVIHSTKGVQGAGFVFPLGGRPKFSSDNIQMYLLGVDSFQTLHKKAESLVAALKQLPTVTYAEVNSSVNSSQFELEINHRSATLLGVDPAAIQQTIGIMFGGTSLLKNYQPDGESYPVYIQLPKKDLENFDALSQLYVKSSIGDWVQISRLVKIKPVVKIPSLETYNQLNAMEIGVTVSGNSTLGHVIQQVESVTHQLLPGTGIAFKGDARDLLEGGSNMLIIFLAGIVFIYLVLAALFESFVDPFIILLTVPLCVIGALLGLKMVGGTLNVYTDIGLITLVGLVSKHGVLIVQFSNELLKLGGDLQEAVIKGAATRLRPILMTSLMMILGALPLVLSTGVGEHARQQIGIVIVAGLAFGTLFSLFIVPVSYLLLKSINYKKKDNQLIPSVI